MESGSHETIFPFLAHLLKVEWLNYVTQRANWQHYAVGVFGGSEGTNLFTSQQPEFFILFSNIVDTRKGKNRNQGEGT